MDIIHDFTEAVVRAEYQESDIPDGYLTRNGRKYWDYMPNHEWDALRAGMRKEHRESYEKGGGKELEEVGNRPPKMASLISSSRMVYLSSRNIPGFCFEAKRPTSVGGTANLDGYLRREKGDIYVEAKCREPYGHAPVERVKTKYLPIYRCLRADRKTGFDCVMEQISEKEMNVVFLCNGEILPGFDIKQMICHLLGIAAYHLRREDTPKPITFLYLLYDPTDLELPEESAGEIHRIYRQTCRAALGYRFDVMFGLIVDYLTTKEKPLPATHAHALKQGFQFELCSQKDYLNMF